MTVGYLMKKERPIIGLHVWKENTMRYIILLALLSGCVNPDGLEGRKGVSEPQDAMPVDTATAATPDATLGAIKTDTGGKEDTCTPINIGYIHSWQAIVRVPDGAREGMIVYVDGVQLKPDGWYVVYDSPNVSPRGDYVYIIKRDPGDHVVSVAYVCGDEAKPDSVCQVKDIGISNNCKIDIPYPGITSDMYLFVGGLTDGIRGPTGHYSWYRVEGQDTIVFINCRYGIDKYPVGVSYSCLP
jgi:hypothetical protein